MAQLRHGFGKQCFLMLTLHLYVQAAGEEVNLKVSEDVAGGLPSEVPPS
jgi:hypothetical protein